MIKELYGRLQDKYSARMQGVSQMENKNFKPREQEVASAIFKGVSALKSSPASSSVSEGVESNGGCNCKM